MRDFMKGYCLKCRENKEIINKRFFSIAGVKRTVIGTCEACGSHIERLLTREEVEELIR